MIPSDYRPEPKVFKDDQEKLLYVIGRLKLMASRLVPNARGMAVATLLDLGEKVPLKDLELRKEDRAREELRARDEMQKLIAGVKSLEKPKDEK